MPECTKGPCDNPAVEQLVFADGRAHWIAYRCENHRDVLKADEDIVRRAPVQQTLGEAVQQDEHI